MTPRRRTPHLGAARLITACLLIMAGPLLNALPASATPPATPPADTPPADTPPADTPPDTPPADTSPAAPPVDTAPTTAPDAAPHRTVVRAPPGLAPSLILDQDRLNRTPERDLPSALAREPGLSVTRLGGLGAFATLSIRGSTPEQLLLVWDGIPLNPADGAPVDLSTLPLGPLDHIAIFRGQSPYSSGINNFGGALSFTSRSPSPTPQAAGELTTGSFGTAIARAFASGRVLTLALDAVTTRSNFRFWNDQGTAWDPSDDAFQTRQNADSTTLSLLAKAHLQLGPATLTLLHLATDLDRGLPGLGVHPTQASRFHLARQLVALRLAATLGSFHTSLTTTLAASTTTVTDPLGEIGLGRGHTSVTSLVPALTASTTLALAPHPNLRLTPALTLALRHEATSGTTLAAAQRTLLSLAPEVTLAHRSGLTLATGARIETSSTSQTSSTSSAPTTTLAAFLRAAYPLTATLQLQAEARLAPRLPSLFERFGDTGLILGNPDLRPETARTAELTLRWDPTPTPTFQLHASAAAYFTQANDLIQFIPNSQGVSRPENLASARLFGLDLDLALTLFDHLALRSTLTLLEARDTSTIAARRGNRLPLRPPLSSSTRLDLFTADSALGSTPGALGAYVTLDLLAGNRLDFAGLVAVPARLLVGAGLYLRSDAAELTLSAMNLTDNRVQDLAGYPLPGLTILASLRLQTSP